MGHAPAAGGSAGTAQGQSGLAGMDHSNMDMRDESRVGFPVGVGVDMIAPNPTDRTGHPGIGLENVGHRVLTYRDMVSLTPNRDTRTPTRRIDIHLTGNMERFMWSFDGERFSENPEPIRFARDERVRVTLVNDTMMQHPIHLHGHFFEVVNGHPGHHPLLELVPDRAHLGSESRPVGCSRFHGRGQTHRPGHVVCPRASPQLLPTAVEQRYKL